jgi:3-methyladenine DNA glycosylase AlkC
MTEQVLLKDELGEQAVLQLADLLSLTMADFSNDVFQKQALAGLKNLELKQRVSHLIDVLAKHLPANFEQAAPILLAIKTHWQDKQQTATWGSFTAWPLIDYVAEYGTEYPDLALTVLKNLTPLFSAEFAIRTFIDGHFDVSYPQILLWSEDPDEHVRRLASEGMRPRLPWGKKLTQFCIDPDAIFPILEALKDDESLYVRKSVANNLNDISKDNPDKVIELCQRWYQDAPENRLWIIRHALRGLIKAGHPKVFPLLGYSSEPQLIIDKFELAKSQLKLGDSVELLLELSSASSEAQNLVLDYKVHHVKANGSLSAKVFKWKNLNLNSKQQLQLNKKHPVKKISTRTYYSGLHEVEILINGVVYGKTEFELSV